MKNVATGLLACLFLNSSYALEQQDLQNDENARLNYSVGYQIGSDFNRQNFEIRPDAVIKGIEDALSGDTQLMSNQEMRKAMAELGKKVAELKQKKRQQINQYEKKNKDFLVENAKKYGVVTTASGLQYRIIEPGSGQKAKATDSVMVNYRGKLIDGTEFDSSYKRNQPAKFKVNRVIKGWTEALQLMPRGSHWQLVIPADLAYGNRGAGKLIPPNSTLIFEVELIAIL